MKFKDKDGNVFEDIELLRRKHCIYLPFCGDCDLYPEFFEGRKTCSSWAEAHPAEAARLMGYEVVEDEPYNSAGTCGICEKFVPMGYSGFGRCAISDAEHRSEDKCSQSEANMDKQSTKPRICELLGVEVGERFRIIGYPKGDTNALFINEEGRVERVSGKNKFKIGNSVAWAINHPECVRKEPRFTKREVKNAKALVRLLAEKWVEGCVRRGPDWLALESNFLLWVLADDAFPSIREGESVPLKEIAGCGQ